MPSYHADSGDDRAKLDFYFANAPLAKYGGYFMEFVENRPGVVEYMTQSLCKRLGYTQDEVMGMLHGEFTRFVYPPDLEKYRRFIFDIAHTLGTDSLIYRMNRRDGSTIYVIDTMRAMELDGRIMVFSAVFDIGEQRIRNLQEQLSRLVEIISRMYEQIVFLDSRRQVLQLLYGGWKSTADGSVKLSLSMTESLKRWASACAAEHEQARILEFLSPVLGNPSGTREGLESSKSITFENLSEAVDGLPGTGEITLMHMGDGVYLLCYRDITTTVLAQHHRELNARMKRAQGYYRSLIDFVVDGLLAFLKHDDEICEIMLCEGAACQYFGLPEIEMESGGSIIRDAEAFIEESVLSNREFSELLDKGAIDLGSSEGVKPRGYARLTQALDNKTGLRWISITRLEQSRGGERILDESVRAKQSRPDVYIRTFGHFEVFVDGVPIPFRHEKSKELLAVLVDRRGGFVGSRDAIGYLWEDETANKVTLARYRKVAMRLRAILEEHGIEDIVETSQRNRRIDTDRVRCDLFDYLWGGPDYAQSFKGMYMSDYSWSEFTLMELSSGRLASGFEEEL